MGWLIDNVIKRRMRMFQLATIRPTRLLLFDYVPMSAHKNRIHGIYHYLHTKEGYNVEAACEKQSGEESTDEFIMSASTSWAQIDARKQMRNTMK